jgi:predicted O-methyltransferase YrrM
MIWWFLKRKAWKIDLNKKFKLGFLFFSLCFFLCLQVVASGFDTETGGKQSLDDRVRNFLDSNRHSWRDMNVSEADGKVLYDIIIKHKYKKALEIGTSTGHSGIWIAWALSKTGGKLITIEINEGRYKQALANFEEAGLSGYIDTRLADAHELVPKLKGPFDFVFCDADKGWYKNYLIAVLPKLEVGGGYTAHNVSGRRRGRMWGIGEFVDYLESLRNMETTYDDSSWSGISISYKKSEK